MVSYCVTHMVLYCVTLMVLRAIGAVFPMHVVCMYILCMCESVYVYVGVYSNGEAGTTNGTMYLCVRECVCVCVQQW